MAECAWCTLDLCLVFRSIRWCAAWADSLTTESGTHSSIAAAAAGVGLTMGRRGGGDHRWATASTCWPPPSAREHSLSRPSRDERHPPGGRNGRTRGSRRRVSVGPCAGGARAAASRTRRCLSTTLVRPPPHIVVLPLSTRMAERDRLPVDGGVHTRSHEPSLAHRAAPNDQRRTAGERQHQAERHGEAFPPRALRARRYPIRETRIRDD